ncbi:hypothetical protein GCM10027614_22600 [Micromonospora vulcania]
MTVTHVHWAALPTMGGIETHLESLVAALRSSGQEVDYRAGTRNARSAVFHPALSQAAVARPPTYRIWSTSSRRPTSYTCTIPSGTART